MCGIAGIWGTADAATLERLLNRLAHRGPDGRGIHRVDGVGVIGSNRLAIMDPAGGAQPLYSEDRTIAAVVNGEIYNAPQLRDQLAATHRMATGSDCETVVHLFEDCDHAAFGLLDGMFAAAVVRGSRLVLARDPLGIKPLYYAWNGRLGAGLRLRFASEMHALADAPDPITAMPPGGLFDSERGPGSFSPGGAALPMPEPLADDPDEIARRLAEAVRKAVRSHLMSDVPVGVFVSGGLDSSIVAAVAREHLPQLHTFSVGCDGSEDLEKARVLAQILGTDHHEYVFSVDEVAAELPRIAHHLESYDRYLVTNAIPNWFCARLAARHIKVALCGEGSDELFAGYTYYQKYQDPAILNRELHRTTADLHQTNLQRVDRMTMAHGVECRVPFFSRDVVNLALAIPTQWKLRDGPGGARFGKWILRRAFDGLLPDEFIWGGKRNFDEGSAITTVLDAAVAKAAETAGVSLKRHRRKYEYRQLKRPAEALFHYFMTQEFGGQSPVLDGVARWSRDCIREPHEPLPPPAPPRRRGWRAWFRR
ncbi:MAG: asparagine synthase-related protein [Candidatus Sumerlaeaceae bacterium]|nr:asparagine synthase-related protein [Candidatus Sumerlaeaceae bacterium]